MKVSRLGDRIDVRAKERSQAVQEGASWSAVDRGRRPGPACFVLWGRKLEFGVGNAELGEILRHLNENQVGN